MRLFLKARTWQEDVDNYLRWWRKLKEQASLMETCVVIVGGGESRENTGLGNYLRTAIKGGELSRSKGTMNQSTQQVAMTIYFNIS